MKVTKVWREKIKEGESVGREGKKKGRSAELYIKFDEIC